MQNYAEKYMQKYAKYAIICKNMQNLYALYKDICNRKYMQKYVIENMQKYRKYMQKYAEKYMQKYAKICT